MNDHVAPSRLQAARATVVAMALLLVATPVRAAESIEPGTSSGFLGVLSNPDVAFLLLVIGGLGIATELVHLNFITGFLGSIALVLAVIGFASLPVNWLGLIVLVFGFVLFVLETQVVSYGLLTLAAVVCVALGASALYNEPSVPGAAAVHVSSTVLVVTVGTLALAMLGISIVAARTRRMRAPVGQLGAPVPIGTPGVVRSPLDPLGTVYLAGETWSARTPDERPLSRSTPVRLAGFDGLTALVEPDLLEPDEPGRHDATALPAPIAGPISPPVSAPAHRP